MSTPSYSSYDSSQEIRQAALPLHSQDSQADSATQYLQNVRAEQNQMADVFVSQQTQQDGQPSALDSWLQSLDSGLLVHLQESVDTLRAEHSRLSLEYRNDPAAFDYSRYLTGLQDSVLNPGLLVRDPAAFAALFRENESAHWIQPCLSILLHLDTPRIICYLKQTLPLPTPILNYNQALWIFCLLSLLQDGYPLIKPSILTLATQLHQSLVAYPHTHSDHREYCAMLTNPLAVISLLQRQHSYLYRFY